MGKDIKVAVIGAGGHGKVILELLFQKGLTIEGIYDETFQKNRKEIILGVPLLGNLSLLKIKLESESKKTRVVIAKGDNKKRAKLFQMFRKWIMPILHNTAYISKGCQIGEGTQIFANVFLGAEAKIGNNVIINTGAIIEHETFIGDNSFVAPGVTVAGKVILGKNCFIGLGSLIIDRLKITDNVFLGAGSVVVKDISEPGVYVGNPAKKIKDSMVEA